MAKAKKSWRRYVADNKKEVSTLIVALKKFERNADISFYSFVEDDNIDLHRRLGIERTHPEKFAREFDKEEDWGE